jgi:hypothetical protein
MDADADPDPSIFIIDIQDANKKLILQKSFSAYSFLKVLIHHFKDKKSEKEPQNSRNQMIERSGSIPLTNGSGSRSRRPKGKTRGSGGS